MSVSKQEPQAEIIAFLSQPESYLHRPERVERLDTHGAIIFLAGNRAYKLKRAVQLAYLDFSTLEKRRAVCERELALNSVTAPEIYLQILPVRRDESGELSFQGTGEPVDWVIEMQRFESDQLFDRLAEQGHLSQPLIERLADVILQFHENAPPTPDADWPNSLETVVGTVTHALEQPELAGLALAETVAALRKRFDNCRHLMVRRRDGGLVRRCHGDLHLKNIVLFAGAPRLFDALEFDEDLATVDVLYDLAFLLMDMWHRDLRDEANLVLNRYFAREVSDLEWAGLSLLPLFLALRAGVRAMVGLDGLAVTEGEKRQALRRETHSYAELAKSLIAPPAARLIAIGGLSGTGKTTVARTIAPALAPVPGAIHLRSDVERKRLLGAEETQRLDASGYSKAVNERVYERLAAQAETILRTGQSVIVDATFMRDDDRALLDLLAERSGTPLEAVWLEAGEEDMTRRVTERHGDASDANAQVVRTQIAQHVGAPPGWLVADASGNAEDTVANVRRCLNLLR